MANKWLFLGSLHGFLSVAFGAFGAHALRDKLDAYHLGVFETGARYEIFHALALLAVAWLASRSMSALVEAAGWSFFLGACLFSFSLYALALSGVKAFGAITPLGGLGFLIGWACLAVLAFKP